MARTILCTFSMNLDAGGWGSRGESFEMAGENWKEVYFDMNDLSFTAIIPNYYGTMLSGGMAQMNGKGSDESSFVIITPFNKCFQNPISRKEFIEIFTQMKQDKDSIVLAIIKDKGKEVISNPSSNYILQEKDNLIIISTEKPE